MSRMNLRRSVVMLFGAAVLLCGIYAGPAPDQRVEGFQGEPAVQLKKKYFGEDRCSGCHKDRKVLEGDALLYRGTEMEVWYSKDKHRNATTVLESDRGKQMGKNLRWDVTKKEECLRCHGVFVEKEEEADNKTFKPEQRRTSGVTCVACHGEYTNWVSEHTKEFNDWRDLDREKKKKLGLKDLWDPETRAALCSSCHVGNAAEKKIVTHEMYAAGHPPLPGIEIATFCDALPRHWETLTEKVAKRGKLMVEVDDGKRKITFADYYKEKHDHGKSSNENLEQTRMVAISALGVFKASMELIAAHADIHAKNKNADGWPEFAMYDCYACHHDLKSDSWRLENPSSGVPGRPGARTWSATLLPLVISHAQADKNDFNDKLKKLDAAFTRTPFGQPADVAKSARDLAIWSKSLLEELKDKPFTRATSTVFLKGLFEHAAGKSLDFDSARQLSWGTKMLFGELYPKELYVADPKSTVPTELTKGPFNDLNKLMSLKLLDGPDPIVGPFLTEALERMSKYEPKDFRLEMKKIAGSVKNE